MSSMLVRLVEDEVGVLVHQFLHGILDKLVEGVELLSDETFLREEATDNSPAVVLRNLLILLFLLVLHVVTSVIVRVCGTRWVKVHSCQ